MVMLALMDVHRSMMVIGRDQPHFDHYSIMMPLLDNGTINGLARSCTNSNSNQPIGCKGQICCWLFQTIEPTLSAKHIMINKMLIYTLCCIVYLYMSLICCYYAYISRYWQVSLGPRSLKNIKNVQLEFRNIFQFSKVIIKSRKHAKRER
jgi:hypothetical protein